MRIIPSVASVVGESGESVWAQTLSLSSAYAAVEVHDQAGIARTLGMQVLSELAKLLGKHPVSLDEAKNIISKARENSGAEIIVLVPVGKILYVASGGSGAVYLKRGQRLTKLIQDTGGISGEAQNGDTLLLATGGLLEVLPEAEIIGTFDHLSAPEAAEKLTLSIHQSGKTNTGAALIYQVTGFAEEDAAGPESAPRFHTRRQFLPVISRRLLVRGLARIKERRFPTAKGIIGRLRRIGGRRRLSALILACLAILLFIASVFIGIRKQQVQNRNKTVMTETENARHLLDEGMALRDLNPVKGRERLTQAKAILEPVIKTLSAGKAEDAEIIELYRQISDNLTLSLRISEVSPELYFEAGLLKENAGINRMSFSGETLSLADTAGKTVFLLKLPSKSGIVAGGGEYVGAGSFITSGPASIFLESGDIVYELATDGSGKNKTVIRNDGGWGKIIGITWFGGNIYLLDQDKGRIWKYVGTGDKAKPFSERREYLNPDVFPDFSTATGMNIDGNVWITTLQGRIMKFSQGREQEFVTQGIEPVLGTDILLYTDDTIEHLYILDRINQRTVSLTKDGVYVAQYVWKNTLVPSGLAVSESLKKVFLLADGKIYSFDIK